MPASDDDEYALQQTAHLTDSQWRMHVERRLNKQDRDMREILAILRASKILSSFIRWSAGVGMFLVAVWAAYKGVKP